MLARRTAGRRVNEALAVISPLAFADAVEAYVTSLPSDELRALVSRSVNRMDNCERMQFALFLGHDAVPGGADEVFSGPTMRVEEVQRLLGACTDFLPNRFAAFLRENPRAVPSLGDNALKDILATLPFTQGDKRAAPPREQRQRVPLQGVLVFALALLIAVVPLAAQYVRQRGMVAETVNPPVEPMLPPVRIALRAPKSPPQPRHAIHRGTGKRTRMPHVARKRVVAIVPSPMQTHARAALPKRTTHRERRVAGVWKFDPRYNPYSNRARFKRSAGVTAAPAPKPPVSGFEARARLVVSAYLGAVIAGNTQQALAHLGMPADGDPKAITESAIVSRGTRAHIVAVKPGEDGTTHVQVDIFGRRGEYFEVFSVAPDGAAVRIKERFYIPVNRTAEEVSARLLARTPH